MQRNVGNQRFHAVAFDVNGRVSGIELNLTCSLQIDGGTRNLLGDATATEIGVTGEYVWDLSQAETNGHELSFSVISSSGEEVVGMPSNVIYTVEDPNITYVVPQSIIAQAQFPEGTSVVYRASQWEVMLEGVPDDEWANITAVIFGVKYEDREDGTASLQVRWDKAGDTTTVLYINQLAAQAPLDTTGAVITHTAYVEDTITYHRFELVVEGEVTTLIPSTNELNGNLRLGDTYDYGVPSLGYAAEWKFVGNTELIIGSGFLVILPAVNRRVE